MEIEPAVNIEVCQDPAQVKDQQVNVPIIIVAYRKSIPSIILFDDICFDIRFRVSSNIYGLLQLVCEDAEYLNLKEVIVAFAKSENVSASCINQNVKYAQAASVHWSLHGQIVKEVFEFLESIVSWILVFIVVVESPILSIDGARLLARVPSTHPGFISWIFCFAARIIS